MSSLSKVRGKLTTFSCFPHPPLNLTVEILDFIWVLLKYEAFLFHVNFLLKRSLLESWFVGTWVLLGFLLLQGKKANIFHLSILMWKMPDFHLGFILCLQGCKWTVWSSGFLKYGFVEWDLWYLILFSCRKYLWVFLLQQKVRKLTPFLFECHSENARFHLALWKNLGGFFSWVKYIERSSWVKCALLKFFFSPS